MVVSMVVVLFAKFSGEFVEDVSADDAQGVHVGFSAKVEANVISVDQTFGSRFGAVQGVEVEVDFDEFSDLFL